MTELIEPLNNFSLYGDDICAVNDVEAVRAEDNLLTLAITISPLLFIHKCNSHAINSPFAIPLAISLALNFIALTHGASADTGWTPLHDLAFGKPQRQSLDKLAKNYGINAQDTWGSTPTHIASKHNSINVLQKLIELGADLSIVDKNGYLPLHTACYYGNNEIIKLLHERGTSLEAQNAYKQNCRDLVLLGKDEGKITAETATNIITFINSKASIEILIPDNTASIIIETTQGSETPITIQEISQQIIDSPQTDEKIQTEP